MAIDPISISILKASTPWLKELFSGWITKKRTKKSENEIWSEITSLVIQQTSNMSERHSKITTIAFPRDTVSIESIYVPLTLITDGGKKATISTYPKDLLKKHNKILIVDVAGMGKSTVAKILYLKSLQEKQILPIMIDLRRLTSEQSVNSALFSQFGLLQKHNDLFNEFLRTQPLLFLFDGFDEVPDDHKIGVARNIRDFIDQNQKSNFVITSRPEVHFSSYTDFSTYRIENLTLNEAYNLINLYGKAYGIEERADALIVELRARHRSAIESFLKNPLLTSLLFRAFEYKSIVPVKRGVFYRQVFDALYDAHDLNKETGYAREKKTGLHHDDFHRALRAMSSLFRAKKVVEVTTSEFIEMSKNITKALCPDLGFSPEDFLSDVTLAVPIFTKDGNYIRWSHKSLMDYFLSEFLLRDYSDSKGDALSRVAFSLESLSNENFLTLVHEADPILFAKAVTIPAIDILVSRYNLAFENTSKFFSKDVSEEMSLFYMGHEILLSTKLIDNAVDDWDIFITDANEVGELSTSEYLPQIILSLPDNQGSIGLFMHNSFAALTVPLASSTLSHNIAKQVITRHELGRRRRDISAPKSTKTLFGSKIKNGKWRDLDEEFHHTISSTRPTAVPLPNALIEMRDNLMKTVAASIKARSDSIF